MLQQGWSSTAQNSFFLFFCLGSWDVLPPWSFIQTKSGRYRLGVSSPCPTSIYILVGGGCGGGGSYGGDGDGYGDGGKWFGIYVYICCFHLTYTS